MSMRRHPLVRITVAVAVAGVVSLFSPVNGGSADDTPSRGAVSNGTPTVARAAGPGTDAPPLVSGAIWPVFHHDARHTGRSAFVGAQNPTVAWKYPNLGNPSVPPTVPSPSIGPDGTIYVGSDGPFDSLYALSPQGTVIWSYLTGFSVDSTPVIGPDRTIYFQGGITKCGINKCVLYSYLHALLPNGTLKWTYATGGVNNDALSSPVIGPDGTIYVGEARSTQFGKGYVTALNPNGTRKWQYQTYSDVQSSPALGPDGTIYAASAGGFLYALSSSGALKWSLLGPYGIIGETPAIGPDGTIYVAGNNGQLLAVDTSGRVTWSFQAGASIYSSPALGSDGTLYFGSTDDYVYALKPDGTLKWRFLTGAVVDSSPAIGGDGTVYVGSEDWFLYALNPDGTLKWQYKTGGYVDSSPAIGANGDVYVDGGDGNLYAFGTSTMVPTGDVTAGGDTAGRSVRIAAGSSPLDVRAR